MLRTALRSLFRRVLELFFRRIEVLGLENVPRSGPTLFAINHPNALVDPLLILCYAPRDVSFLAKEPIFRMPVIGWLARAIDAIPVYRRQDQFDTTKNRETFTFNFAFDPQENFRVHRLWTSVTAPKPARHRRKQKQRIR